MITTIGNHRVKKGNIADGLDDLMQGEKAEIFFTDPPWGSGNIKYWNTLNYRMTGEEEALLSLDQFLNATFSLAIKHTKNKILIVYGVRWEKNIIAFGKQYGLRHHGVAETKYHSGSRLLPVHIHVFSKHGLKLPQDYFTHLYGTHGFESMMRAIKPLAIPNTILLDPACGVGLYGKVAINCGMFFRGNEMNEKRLEKTIRRLQNDTS